MTTIFMTGSHPRHLHVAKRLYDEGLLDGLLIEKREEFVPSPSSSWPEIDGNNFIRHFQDRDHAEQRSFGAIKLDYFNKIPIKQVTLDQLNSQETAQWVSSMNPDTVLSYGIHKLNDDMLAVLPERAWNIHGGLSPWYRGNTTLFWPFYFLKPNWAGMTVHHLTSKLDGGDIIHHSVPMLSRGEGIHDVACNAVKQVAEDLIRILKLVRNNQTIVAVPQKSSGKLFMSADWMPQHLRLIYNTFDNDIVDRYLDGEIVSEAPKLVKAF
ncbi:formyltransferase family protein [Cohnella cholangitidis]|uniref:Methionyl-tRNA formyltransferase n=1 Tax=Cohnella cholangitidis TaxID=2598458 RepID=A0A7G5BXH5_9BACL|nr:formyltransferase family protein [Cohnella cholangitidis]QMV41659.1 methionyl-tRNA formyltransferase [Cohnella cholangitidis]